MGDFKNFVENVNKKMGFSLPDSWTGLTDVQLAQLFLGKINEYFFQTYNGIGVTTFDGEELKYFSEFHKFWETNHKEIINVKISTEQAQLVAQALSNAIRKYGEKILGVTHQTSGLQPKAIAQVRFFTANQDFREPPENQFGKYFDDPTRFDAQEIADNPEDFLKFLGTTRLSQTDKRLDFARNAANFLLEKNITAFDIAKYLNNDAAQIREALVNTANMGYGFKKANMFIRDMVELGVWPNLTNFDKIDVASDINTMKLALRAQILQTDIPLLSSFLDIFCYQYGHIDEMSAKAWRKVWEEWKNFDPSTVPLSPCQMDFLLYRIGREYCKELIVQYECLNRHVFYHFGAQLKNCPICNRKKDKISANPKKRLLPCQLESSELPRENNKLLLREDNLLRIFDGKCILESVCNPKAKDFCALNPPKSISIKGQTSWTSSYADREKGGGGMMG
ncbi:MAG: hypothetical protein Q8M95_10995 [Candidatus Methanoperedens sp.]|nr:hypothetical protein [Candidatus Methanoperedens sp.]